MKYDGFTDAPHEILKMTRGKTTLTPDTAIIAIAQVQAAYNCSDLEAITKMQGAAAKAGDEQSLEVLCEIKNQLI